MLAEMHRCGVPGASKDDVREWLQDTVEYLADEFPSLSQAQLAKLKMIGQNYVAPPIPHGAGNDATTREDWMTPQDEGVLIGAVA